jgi:hypothetical protein
VDTSFVAAVRVAIEHHGLDPDGAHGQSLVLLAEIAQASDRDSDRLRAMALLLDRLDQLDATDGADDGETAWLSQVAPRP